MFSSPECQKTNHQLTSANIANESILFFRILSFLVAFCVPSEIKFSFSHFMLSDLLIHFQPMSWWRYSHFLFLITVRKWSIFSVWCILIVFEITYMWIYSYSRLQKRDKSTYFKTWVLEFGYTYHGEYSFQSRDARYVKRE